MPPTPKLHAPARWADHPIRILMVGCGGTGSELLGFLAKASFALNEMGHPGFQVCVFDADVVERPNLGRSNFYPCDIGYNKAVVSIQRINLTWGFAWDAMPCHFDATEAFYGSLTLRPDLIADSHELAHKISLVLPSALKITKDSSMAKQFLLTKDFKFTNLKVNDG